MMELNARLSRLMILAVALLVMAGCANSPQNNTGTTSAPSPQTSTGAPVNVAKNATITANPNPIKVCDGTGLGVTTLTFDAKGPSLVEVRVGTPSGGLLAHSGPTGTATSGKWVSDGTVFYLQDVSGGKATTPDNTLATLTVGVTTAGCN
jgi:hypothetical protein